jgi:hypothetical protein
MALKSVGGHCVGLDHKGHASIIEHSRLRVAVGHAQEGHLVVLELVGENAVGLGGVGLA